MALQEERSAGRPWGLPKGQVNNRHGDRVGSFTKNNVLKGHIQKVAGMYLNLIIKGFPCRPAICIWTHAEACLAPALR